VSSLEAAHTCLRLYLTKQLHIGILTPKPAEYAEDALLATEAATRLAS